MLAEMIGSEELFAAVAFPELVRVGKVLDTIGPVALGCHATIHGVRRSGTLKVLAAVAARVSFPRTDGAFVVGLVVAGHCFAAPTMPSHMQAVLVPFSLVLVLEPVAAEGAPVLLFRLVRPV